MLNYIVLSMREDAFLMPKKIVPALRDMRRRADDQDEVRDAGFHDDADAALARGRAVRGGRRCGFAWSPPAPRLRDYVQALRAVWRCWEKGEKLDYQG